MNYNKSNKSKMITMLVTDKKCIIIIFVVFPIIVLIFGAYEMSIGCLKNKPCMKYYWVNAYYPSNNITYVEKKCTYCSEMRLYYGCTDGRYKDICMQNCFSSIEERPNPFFHEFILHNMTTQYNKNRNLRSMSVCKKIKEECIEYTDVTCYDTYMTSYIDLRGEINKMYKLDGVFDKLNLTDAIKETQHIYPSGCSVGGYIQKKSNSKFYYADDAHYIEELFVTGLYMLTISGAFLTFVFCIRITCSNKFNYW
jgi:hypothetical protein